MNYFQIRETSNSKITGIKDGTSQAVIDRSGFSDKANYDKYIDYFLNADPKTYWKNVGTFPDFDVNLECVALEETAILTDFISYDPNLHHGGKFLVSNKALQILLRHNLGSFRIYNVSMYRNKDIYTDYKLLYCPPLPYEVIDFKKTLFFTGNSLRGKKIFNVESADDFEKMKEDHLFQTQQIVFNKQFNLQLDYFISKVSLPSIFISERLKDAFINENLTGLNIIPANDPILLFEN